MRKDHYFVMLLRGDYGITPLLHNESVAMFESVEEAMEAGFATTLGQKYGFSVFDTEGYVDGADAL